MQNLIVPPYILQASDPQHDGVPDVQTAYSTVAEQDQDVQASSVFNLGLDSPVPCQESDFRRHHCLVREKVVMQRLWAVAACLPCPPGPAFSAPLPLPPSDLCD